MSISDTIACARKLDDTLWCWGDPRSTGTNLVATLGVPMQVSADTDWTSVEARWEHACARKPDGHAWCWGYDDYGLEVVPGMPGTVAVPSDQGLVWDDFRMGGHHYCGETGGRWYCYGTNAYGQLGDGELTPRQAPTTPLCTAASM